MKQIALIFLLITTGFNLSGQGTILWRVTDSLNNKTSYLFGTYHQIGNHFIDSLPIIKQKLLKSNLAIFENIEQGNKDFIFNRPDNSIHEQLGKKYLKKLQSFSADWKYPINKLTPLELSIKLQQEFDKYQCGLVVSSDKHAHMDNYLQFVAKSNQIPLFGFENDSIQAALISQSCEDCTWEKLRKRIYYWIDANLGSNDAKRERCEFADKYRKFEIDYNLEKKCPESTSVILIQRNEHWLKELPALLSNNNCFVAVGLAHLYYDCGLIAELRKRGFKIEEVKMKS